MSSEGTESNQSAAAAGESASAAPSDAGSSMGGGGGEGTTSPTKFTVLKTGAFAFLLVNCFGWGMGWYGFMGFLAFLIFTGRLIYWAVPGELPGRTPKIEFAIDLACAILCVISAVCWMVLTHGWYYFFGYLGMHNLCCAILMCILAFFEYKASRG